METYGVLTQPFYRDAWLGPLKNRRTLPCFFLHCFLHLFCFVGWMQKRCVIFHSSLIGKDFGDILYFLERVFISNRPYDSYLRVVHLINARLLLACIYLTVPAYKCFETISKRRIRDALWVLPYDGRGRYKNKNNAPLNDSL